MPSNLDLSTFAESLNSGPNELFLWTYQVLLDFEQAELYPLTFQGEHFADRKNPFGCFVHWAKIERNEIDFALEWKVDQTKPSLLDLLSRSSQRAFHLLNTQATIDSDLFEICRVGYSKRRFLTIGTLAPQPVFSYLEYRSARRESAHDLSMLTAHGRTT